VSMTVHGEDACVPKYRTGDAPSRLHPLYNSS